MKNNDKKIEVLFEGGNYDTKKILNRSDIVIDSGLLDKLDKGITCEFLETIGVPVFKYKTQITIHGIFPEIDSYYIGGYKHLIQNKNKSIGVKYNAVDYEKKKRIYNTMSIIEGWNVQKNSSEYFSYKCSERAKTMEEVKSKANKLKEELEHIDTSLFIGSTGVSIYASIYGGFFAMKWVSINAIKESDISKCLTNVLQLDINDIQSRIKIHEDNERLKREDIEREHRESMIRQEEDKLRRSNDIEPKYQELINEILKSGYSIHKGGVKNGMKLIYPRKTIGYSYDTVDIVCVNIFEKNGKMLFNSKFVNSLNDIKFAPNREFDINTKPISKLDDVKLLYILN